MGLLKSRSSSVFEQAEIDHGMQSVLYFELCLDDVAEHVFPGKAGQTQKRYMRRNLQLEDKLMDILEYGVPVRWCREFTVQGFDPVDQGLNKIVEFYTHLELCELSADKPKNEKSPKAENAGKHKAYMPTKPTAAHEARKTRQNTYRGRQGDLQGP
eukprot:13351738-Ditylum_brightwellii.AAC.2